MIRLHCKAQTYHWGKRGLDTLVGKAYLASVPSLPESAELFEEANHEHYAELWIGDHPNGPAEILINDDPQLAHVLDNHDFIKTHHGKDMEIGDIIKLNPERFLGQAYLDHFTKESAKYRTSMAFLFKILSVEKALSIQAHPNKTLAQKLHAERPDLYKDDNHKPEIAIAIDDDFVACFGFLTADKLKQNLIQNQTLSKIFNYDDDQALDEEFLKKCVYRMFYELDKDHEKLEKIILELVDDISKIEDSERSEHQRLCLTLLEQYGQKDIGILFTFFFNIFKLKKDEAVVISANEPHAYIRGDLIECMANSDNVVRGGLTPKFKDTDTLYNMLPYEMKERMPVHGQAVFADEKSDIIEYKSGFKEFRVFKVEIKEGGKAQLKFNSFSMTTVIKGSGQVEVEGFGDFGVETYCAYYILPNANLTISNNGSDNLVLYLANCDI